MRFSSATIGVLLSILIGGIIVPPSLYTVYYSADQIPAIAYQQSVTLRGEISKVIDGDTVRFRHTPLFSLVKQKTSSGKFSEQTITIRLAGIDCPETAKRGQPGQPFADEATNFVKKKVLNQKVRVKIRRKDQYSRLVGQVSYGPWPFRKSLEEELLKEGLAVVYKGGGAEYGGKKQELLMLESTAKNRKKGLWSKKHVELPSAYKSRISREQVPKAY